MLSFALVTSEQIAFQIGEYTAPLFSLPSTGARSLVKTIGLRTHPVHEVAHILVVEQRLNSCVVFGKLRLGKQGMQLPVANTVQYRSGSATF
jgi:hypothetical protein